MTWVDRFKEGSFRGAPFFISESRGTFGRRNHVHEYPGRNTPWADDRGRAARKWSVECFVVGPDYDLARDALIKAIEADGAATLVHPYLGTFQALCTPSDVVDSTANGGMATFSLMFVEAGSNTAPAAAADTQARAAASATAAKAAAAKSAAGKLTLLNQVTQVAKSAQAMIAKVKAAINTALAPLKLASDALFTIQQDAQAVVTGGLALLNAPRALVSDLFTSAGGLANLGPVLNSGGCA